MTFDTNYDGNGRDIDDIARLLAGGKVRGRKRMRRLLIARLISDKRGAEADDEYEGIDEDEGGGEDQRLARLLVGGAVRKRRLRRLVLAQMLRQRGDEDEDEGIEDEEGGDEDRRLAQVLVEGPRRRRRLRRLVLAHVLSERRDEDESEGIEDDDDDRQLVRFLVGQKAMRRGRARRMAGARELRH